MKFGGSVDVNQPLEKTAELFANPDYLKEYQDGFLRKELVSGNKGMEGAVSKMYYKHGKQEMELTETITENKLPYSFEAFYQHKHMDNTLKATFTVLSDTQTRYTAEGEYLVFRGFVPKMMAFLFPGMFRKQAQKWMDNFKAFAEKQ